MPHPNSNQHFNATFSPRGKGGANTLITERRRALDTDYTTHDDTGKPLSVADMVKCYFEKADLNSPLPTGLADRVAALALSPVTKLEPTERNILKRLGGVPQATSAGHTLARFAMGSVPTSDGERVIQQSPVAIARLMPAILRDMNPTNEHERNTALGAIIISAVATAEESVPPTAPPAATE